MLSAIIITILTMSMTVWSIPKESISPESFKPDSGGDDGVYMVGMGRYDITGPVADVNMMGYAMMNQIAHGLHLRQYSRAFVFSDTDGGNRHVFVSIDACMGTQIVKSEVVAKLNELFPSVYSESNVLISAIHTHSGPAGFFQYLLFELTSLGYVNQTTFAIVDGIVESIVIAHNSMKQTKIFTNEGEVKDANINRSPSSYLLNPASERAQYKHDTDTQMVLMKFVDASTGAGTGLINWHAVHCTSMNRTNELISSDNKGYASILAEKHFNPEGTPAGRGEFVAAFAQSNLGDVSPNTQGPHCLDTGEPCDILTSTCGGRNEKCVAFGPGEDMFDSTKIIGKRAIRTNLNSFDSNTLHHCYIVAQKQYEVALELYKSATTQVTGPLGVVEQTVDMTNQVVTLADGTEVHTCKPAMGYSFAAGTTDGPGAFDFTQGTNTSNFLWNLVRDLIKDPSEEQKKCQHPKPILLDTGELNWPYPWQAHIVDTQLLRIGQFVIIGVPGEFTTMSGRRLRKAVSETLVENGMPADTQVVIAGLSNVYSDYIATFEEFQAQRYEAASTIYGPHTLAAYIQQYQKLASALVKGTTVPSGPTTPNYRSEQVSFLEGVLFDGGDPGTVVKQPHSSYKVESRVEVVFETGHPKNNLLTNLTFLEVQYSNDQSGEWEVVATDSEWETRFHWVRTNYIEGKSDAVITWDIPATAQPGKYRIQHYGYRKRLSGKIVPFTGVSNEFTVTS